jgi:hypothetical protein
MIDYGLGFTEEDLKESREQMLRTYTVQKLILESYENGIQEGKREMSLLMQTTESIKSLKIFGRLLVLLFFLAALCYAI